MKTILLTGASGFIGKNFVNKYKKKYFFFLLLKKKVKKYHQLKNSKNIKHIFFKKNNEIPNLIGKLKINYFINLATYHTNENDTKSLEKIIDSNISFPAIVMGSINKKNLNKVITIGSMHEHCQNRQFLPNNIYASSKGALNCFVQYYKKKFKSVNFYNLKFYETYSFNDKRKKIIPTLAKNFQNKKITKILSPKLLLNFIHIDDIAKAIEIIIKKRISSGSYLIKSKNYTNIVKLINKFNMNNKKKIKFEVANNPYFNITYKINPLPFWRQTRYIEKDFKKICYGKN